MKSGRQRGTKDDVDEDVSRSSRPTKGGPRSGAKRYSWLALGLLAVFAAACSPENAALDARPRPRVVAFLVLDTARADRVATLKTLTPNLVRFAASTVVFERARTPAPFTMPAMASLMTGRYPHEAGIVTHSRGERLAPRVPTLAELFQRAGYETAAVVTNPWLASRGTGFARGFETFISGRDLGGERTRMSAERVASQGLAILGAHRHRPLFLWLHFMDAHMPYGDVLPPNAVSRDFVGSPAERSRLFFRAPYTEEELRATRASYDAAIAKIDTALAPVLDALGDDAIVFVLADHGESLGEHGLHFAHDFTLYDELLRVPLLVKVPGVRPARSTATVSLVDIAPTVCALAKLECATDLSGTMLPEIAPPADPSREMTASRPLFATSAPARARYDCPWLTVPGLRGRASAVVRDDRKLIRLPTRSGPRYQAYDLAADPAESTDRYDSERDAALVALLEQWTAAAVPAPKSTAASDPISKPLADELRELGYLD